jgi:hypothetical protein
MPATTAQARVPAGAEDSGKSAKMISLHSKMTKMKMKMLKMTVMWKW